MIHSRRTFALRTTAALGAPAMPSFARIVDAQTLTSITVGVLPPSDISAEPYYALAQGFFRQAGLEATVEPLANGSAIIAAVVSGHFDVAYSNMISLAVARERGIESVVLAPANLHVSNAPTAGILAVNKSSSIKTARDLNGKLIAVEGLNNIAQISAEAWIDKNGGDSKAAKWVEITLSAMPAALTSGRIDAAVMNALYDTTAGKPDDPFRRLCTSTFDAIAPRFAPSVWFTTPRWAAQRPQAAAAFMRAMRDAAAWANRHRAESAAILAQYTKQSIAEIQSVRRVTYGETITPALIQPAIDVAARYGLIKAPFNAADVIVKTRTNE